MKYSRVRAGARTLSKVCHAEKAETSHRDESAYALGRKCVGRLFDHFVGSLSVPGLGKGTATFPYLDSYGIQAASKPCL
eukprot:6197868-Pleurochrysis_carterae.AAC.1